VEEDEKENKEEENGLEEIDGEVLGRTATNGLVFSGTDDNLGNADDCFLIND
jgi:hypothetical protein